MDRKYFCYIQKYNFFMYDQSENVSQCLCCKLLFVKNLQENFCAQFGRIQKPNKHLQFENVGYL